MKAVSLEPLIEHIYLEDRRQAILQLASNANVTISYHVKQGRRSLRPAKAPEKSSSLKAIIPVVNELDYVITFDGFGPEENESIKFLRKAFEKKEIRLL